MNYKLVIVDDEPIFRHTLQNIIHNIPQYQVVYTAADGQDAFDFILANPVDIVITDIKMPRMDGIQLIEQIYKESPNIVIAALSAYEEYPLIRAAFKAGACDYLLKTDIDPENIRKLLASLEKQMILKCNPQILRQRDLAVQSGNSSKHTYQAMRQHFNEWVYGSTIHENEIKEYLVSISRYISAESYDCILIEADNFKQIADLEWKNNQEILHFACMNILEEKFLILNKSAVFPFAYDSFVILLAHQSSLDPILDSLKEMQTIIEATLHIHISFGIGGPQKSLEMLRILIHHAAHALQTGCPSYEWNAITTSITLEDLEIIPLKIQNILTSLEPDNILPQVSQLLPKAAFLPAELFSPLITMYDKLEFILSGYCDRMRFSKLKSSICREYQSIKSQPKQYLHSYETWFKNAISDIVQEKEKFNSLVMQARNIIDQNFSEDLSLDKVSEELFVTPSYLSRLFKKHMGVTFSDYLNEIRIQKAEELLNTTQYKIWEIAELVGFHSVEYFSRVYRKKRGHSPKS